MKGEFDPAGKCGSCGHYKELPGTRTGRCQAQVDLPQMPWCSGFWSGIDPHPLVTQGQRKCHLYKERSKGE